MPSLFEITEPISLAPGFSFSGPFDQILPKHLLDSNSWLKRTESERGSDQYWMAEALNESLKGTGVTHPNPSVGCILVNQKGKEVSRGHTQAFPGLHAERVAFNNLKDVKNIKNGTAYVTLEPCSHFGNNPPCVDLLIQSPIRRIVIARNDPNPLINGRGVQKLIDSGKEVTLGVFEHEMTGSNIGFFAQHVLNRPLFILKWAQTLDGQLADDLNQSKWISGEASRTYTHWLRRCYDAILIGAKTLIHDTPQLTARLCHNPTLRNPVPIIFDPKGLTFDVPEKIQEKISGSTFTQGRKCFLVTSELGLKKYPTSWLFNKSDIKIFPISDGTQISELSNLLSTSQITQELGRPIQSVFIEGGSKTLSHFFSSGYADVIHTFISTKISGGSQNRIATDRLLQDALHFQLISTARMGSDILMEMISKEIKRKLFTRI